MGLQVNTRYSLKQSNKPLVHKHGFNFSRKSNQIESIQHQFHPLWLTINLKYSKKSNPKISQGYLNLKLPFPKPQKDLA